MRFILLVCWQGRLRMPFGNWIQTYHYVNTLMANTWMVKWFFIHLSICVVDILCMYDDGTGLPRGAWEIHTDAQRNSIWMLFVQKKNAQIFLDTTGLVHKCKCNQTISGQIIHLHYMLRCLSCRLYFVMNVFETFCLVRIQLVYSNRIGYNNVVVIYDDVT